MTSHDKLTSKDHAYIDRIAVRVLPTLLRQQFEYSKASHEHDANAGKLDAADCVEGVSPTYGTCEAWKEVAEEAYCIGWAMWYARHEVLSQKPNPLAED